MPTLNCKQGVDPSNCQPEILLAVMVAQSVYASHGYDCVITSLKDGVHSKTSLHYRDGICRAVDLRTNHLPVELIANITAEIALRLPTGYDVVQEKDHLHVEWDPKPVAPLPKSA
jgi:hypothetical protein